MTTTAPTPTRTTTAAPAVRCAEPRTTRDDVRAIPAALRSEWIKVSTLRVSRVILALGVVVAGVAAWAVAVAVTDEVLTVAQVFVYPTVLIAALAAVAGILVFTSEAQHGTLAMALAGQPTRWVIVLAKVIVVIGCGLVLGAAAMAAGAAGSALGGLELGDGSAMVTTALFALLYTALAATFGLGVGMIVRHSAGAVTGLLVWWFVVENLILAFAPATIARFLPFDAGYRVLGVGSDFDSPEMIAAALTRPQYAAIFAGYATITVLVGAVLVQRRDVS